MDKPIADGPWPLGCNSLMEPTSIPTGQYQWAVNCVNRGGIVQTRPGFSILPVPKGIGRPRGITVFTPTNGVATIVIAVGSQVLQLPYPFTGTFAAISGIAFNTLGPVVFQHAIKNVDEASDGTLTVIDAKQLLMMCDGESRTAFWDGTTGRHLDPNKNETPTFKWMKYIGGRLWGSNGNKLRAANLLNPILMTEENILSEGGSFSLSSDITGMGATPDFSNLLVCTDATTSSFQANITDRTQWELTPSFQKLIFPNIGCAAGKSFVNQWGITSWYSHGGLIGLDQALQTYRTSRINYTDQNMMRSKGNISPDVSGICCGSFENYQVVSVPSGDIYNAQTWILDNATSWMRSAYDPSSQENLGVPAWSGAWTGVRPVEWVTAVINGKSRCFVLSMDYPATGDTVNYQSNVWEMFIGERFDIGADAAGNITTKEIDCRFETKMLGHDGLYKMFRFAELDLSQISGTVNLTVSYAGKTGGYKSVLQKQIVATRAPIVNGVTTIHVDTSMIEEYRPQNRVIRTQNEETILSDDSIQGVESVYTRKKDLAFSLLIEWTGRMAVSAIRLYANTEAQEPEGVVEANEVTDRYVQMDGVEQILQTSTPVVYDGFNNKSQYSSPFSPRWKDRDYKSLT